MRLSGASRSPETGPRGSRSQSGGGDTLKKTSRRGVQPPVFGPPFKLVSGDAFSAPSAVLPKVQEVDNSELNVV